MIQHSICFEIMGEGLKNHPEQHEVIGDENEEAEHSQRGNLVDEENDEEPEDEEDEVLDIIGMTVENFDGEEDGEDIDSDTDEDNDEDDADDVPLPGDDSDSDVSNIFTVTKYGRVASNWRTSLYR